MIETRPGKMPEALPTMLQRLTLDNHKLRHALEAASNVTRIGTTRTP